MGFGGPSGEEKARSGKIEGISDSILGSANKAQKKSNKSFKWFKESTLPAMDFFKTILEGDRNALTELFSPEISKMTSIADNQKMKIGELLPRGGGQVAAVNNIDSNLDKSLGDIITSARPQAATSLTNIGGLFGNVSQGFGGQAIGGKSAAVGPLFGLNDAAIRERERKTEAWTGLGQGVGGVAGSIFGGK